MVRISAFRFDAGWLYLVPGLTLCVACVVLPAQEDLQTQKDRMAALATEEQRLCDTLEAYNGLLTDLDRDDPDVIRQLAATQLNLMPAGNTPVLIVEADSISVTDWLDARIDARPAPPRTVAPAPSRLDRLANGRHRLWIMGLGALLAFIGLLLSPALTSPKRPAPPTGTLTTRRSVTRPDTGRRPRPALRPRRIGARPQSMAAAAQPDLEDAHAAHDPPASGSRPARTP